MSKEYQLTINSHPNVYNNMFRREMNVYFSEPDEGVNENTGLLLLIPGFGANSNSKVYKKMRSHFSDTYNFVTIQYDYFGWEYMQSEILKESVNNFNDMGLLQALDNITAIIIVSEIIKDNDLKFNANKVVAYGHSHGAYLAYLSNVFAPGLFSAIIDNSSWLYPVYLQANRYLNLGGKQIVFDYIAKSIVEDKEILYLPAIYENYTNKSFIYSFHGEHDNLISLREKRKFCQSLNQCYLHEITADQLDYRIFKSTTHGLQADFLLLFDHVVSNYRVQSEGKASDIHIDNQEINTKQFVYTFDYSRVVPVLQVESV